MSDRLKELREERGTAAKEMEAITDKGLAEKRDLTGEELAKHTDIFQRVMALGEQITAEERSIEAKRLIADRQIDPPANVTKPKTEAELRMAGFRGFLRTGDLNGEGSAEFRAFQAGSDTQGGFLAAPEEFVNMLLKTVDNLVYIRSKATVYQIGRALSLGVPTLDTDASDTDWTTELATGNEETSLLFGKRKLEPHPLAKNIKVSNELLRAAIMPVEEIINQRLGYKFGVTEEKAFLSGSGAQQPLGVFTANTNGISTNRDFSTGNTATSMSLDGIMEAKYQLKTQYWGKCEWMFHRDGVKQLVKLKDGEGQYIWRASVSADEPDTLLGRPITISEYVPNTFTSGLYVGILGDFSYYWIADSLDMQMQRLVELYAATNQVGFIARKQTDGMPVLEEAFSRVKLA